MFPADPVGIGMLLEPMGLAAGPWCPPRMARAVRRARLRAVAAIHPFYTASIREFYFFGVPTHAEAKDVLAGAMLRYARGEAEAGPVTAPRGGVSEKPTVTLLGEMFPADPVGIGMMLEPMGLAAGPVVPTREWRELYAALDCAAVAAIHPFYTASVREFETAGRCVVPSAPVGHDGTEAWLQAIGNATNVPQAHDRRGQEQVAAAPSRARWRARRSRAASPSAATKARNCWWRGC